jgi:hypothetical protein
MRSPGYDDRLLKTHLKLVASKLRAGDIEWLAERLTRVYQANSQLTAANDGLRERNRQLEAQLLRCRQRRGNRSLD